MSPSAKRAWIEMRSSGKCRWMSWSPSAKRAWIEIDLRPPWGADACVALCEEGVDRNFNALSGTKYMNQSPSAKRAWIEMQILQSSRPGQKSPSAKRAWIEITSRPSPPTPARSPSAKRAWIEIKWACQECGESEPSPSAKRAWIEMISSQLSNLNTLGRPLRRGRG